MRRAGLLRSGLLLMCVLPLAAVRAGDIPEFALSVKAHQFEPAELVIPAATKVKLIIHNLDAAPEEFESYELKREKVIPGQSSGLLFIGPLAPGTYPFFGDFNPETARGHLLVK